MFGFALKWRECTMHMQYKDYVTMWPNCWPGRRVPTIHAILKNCRKYMQHGTSLNRNKQWEISLAFSNIVIKGDIKDKKL